VDESFARRLPDRSGTKETDTSHNLCGDAHRVSVSTCRDYPANGECARAEGDKQMCAKAGGMPVGFPVPPYKEYKDHRGGEAERHFDA
jgi:hypothetical protein